MYIKEHSSGTGFMYQKKVPRAFRPLFKKAHISSYIPGPQTRAGKLAAARIALDRAAADAAKLAILQTLPESEREAFVAGWDADGVRKMVAYLEGEQEMDVDENWLLTPADELVTPGTYYPGWTRERFDLTRLETLQTQRARVAELAERRELLARMEGRKPRQLGNTMADVFDLWKKRKSPKFTDGHKRTVERFIAICGDLSVKDIDRKNIRSFYDANEREQLGRATQVKHRDHLKALLSVAAREGWIDNNPAGNVDLNAAKPGSTGDGKKPFEPAQLAMILERAQAGFGPAERHADNILALKVLVYSGCRANEVAGLKCSDVMVVDGVDVLRLRETADQSLKNKPSARLVPLHHTIRADVVSRAAAGLASGQTWLFPSFSHREASKHSRLMRSDFNGTSTKGFLRGVCGIKDPALSLHSTRHSLIDACRRSGMPEDIQRRLVGHSLDVHGKYGRGAGLQAMAAALGAVDPLR